LFVDIQQDHIPLLVHIHLLPILKVHIRQVQVLYCILFLHNNTKLVQDVLVDLIPKITVCGLGGAGGNTVNNMINKHFSGVDFLVANTDAQVLLATTLLPHRAPCHQLTYNLPFQCYTIQLFKEEKKIQKYIIIAGFGGISEQQTSTARQIRNTRAWCWCQAFCWQIVC
jgi:hypothetical protein